MSFRGLEEYNLVTATIEVAYRVDEHKNDVTFGNMEFIPNLIKIVQLVQVL
jgi:hypothetical protein